ncbi:MAG: TetR/AcrR family transcriptional regulator [Candidatus Leucobacter sulfamidivorax]|nr:TetR/AcrR family transcriptional regulator [Candidatus Leucobacter sulfamidivorax]
MSEVDKPPTATRRRGAKLEAALLNAAWDELVARGYLGLTFEGVAERAGTSRPVVNRRWTAKSELVSAAARHAADQRQPVKAPDTGSLRSDTIELLRQIADDRSEWFAVLTAQLAGYFSETGSGLEGLSSLVRERHLALLEVVVARAVARGEVLPEKITSRRLRSPLDLLDLEMLILPGPVPEESIETIVDDVFLPLVKS